MVRILCTGCGGRNTDLFLRSVADCVGADDTLCKIDALMDWARFMPLLKRGLKRSGIGPQGYDPLVLSRCLLIGQWHGLSDPKLERALKVRLDFMIFCGLDLPAQVPDETTRCRFRNALVKAGVHDELLAEVCDRLEGHGLTSKQAGAAIIDATSIESAARAHSHVEAPEDRAEGDARAEPNVQFSADPDARWVKNPAEGRKQNNPYTPNARNPVNQKTNQARTAEKQRAKRDDNSSASNKRHDGTQRS